MQEDLMQTITEQLVLTKTSLFGQLEIFSNNFHFTTENHCFPLNHITLTSKHSKNHWRKMDIASLSHFWNNSGPYFSTDTNTTNNRTGNCKDRFTATDENTNMTKRGSNLTSVDIFPQSNHTLSQYGTPELKGTKKSCPSPSLKTVSLFLRFWKL